MGERKKSKIVSQTWKIRCVHTIAIFLNKQSDLVAIAIAHLCKIVLMQILLQLLLSVI